MKRPRRWRVNLLSGRTASLWLLAVLFLTGSIAGCMAAGLLSGGEAAGDYLDGYLAVLEQSLVSIRPAPVVWRAVRVPLAAFLLGMTALGVLGLPVLFGVRGFCLCYACSALFRLMGARGVLVGLCLFGVTAVFWLPSLLELGMTGLACSYGLLRRVTGEGRYPLPLTAGRYWGRCGLCFGLVLMGAVAEMLLVPALVRLVLRFT